MLIQLVRHKTSPHHVCILSYATAEARGCREAVGEKSWFFNYTLIRTSIASIDNAEKAVGIFYGRAKNTTSVSVTLVDVPYGGEDPLWLVKHSSAPRWLHGPCIQPERRALSEWHEYDSDDVHVHFERETLALQCRVALEADTAHERCRRARCCMGPRCLRPLRLNQHMKDIQIRAL